ncbi:DNA polymerase IV [Clostridium sp. 'White wine YQ']|uniref:DNA polymerase IV n=1 Tax=Clostridium sp. 'White wine YQ' TaxID=3027474 RepID=UPI0023650755|nr:DNA polymerase IV [Clostridium sp. 'White wine YQ']MDD7794564.1 DNA polymerase IV [Clostridium sp. 'White wine YQ']
MERRIIHVDMDAFFASVEVMDNKSLKGKPVIVGGTSERGVVSTCSYEARAYGVHSAMPIFMAKERCPHGIFLPVRYGRYKEISKKVFDILEEVSNIIEPLSIDEAYIDITSSKFETMEAAKYIKNRVKTELGLTISVGISYNKFLAKLASDWNKPDGIMEITKEMMPEILFPLPISKVYGLGVKSVQKLNNIGVFKVHELYKLPKELFSYYFGKFGNEIYDRIRGIDNRPVKISHERKSIGKETTLKHNTNDINELRPYLENFSREIAYLLSQRELSGRTITIKYKTWDFKSHTRSKTLNTYINSYEDIFNESFSILTEESIEEDLRLIGLSISSLKENTMYQMRLF